MEKRALRAVSGKERSKNEMQKLQDNIPLSFDWMFHTKAHLSYSVHNIAEGKIQNKVLDEQGWDASIIPKA